MYVDETAICFGSGCQWFLRRFWFSLCYKHLSLEPGRVYDVASIDLFTFIDDKRTCMMKTMFKHSHSPRTPMLRFKGQSVDIFPLYSSNYVHMEHVLLENIY